MRQGYLRQMFGLGHGPVHPGPARVLHLVSTFAVKTDTKWLLQLARYLDRARFEMTVACFYEGGPVQQQLESIGVRTFNLDMPSERDPRAIIAAQRVIDHVGPDVVHTHLLRADLYGSLGARLSRVPMIVSSVYAMGKFRRAKRRATDRLLDVACARLPMHVLAVSHAVKNDCVERLRMEPGNITVIHTGIEPPRDIADEQIKAVRAAWGVGPDERVVLTIARLSYEKGIETLIDAAAMCHEGHPEAKFVVLGDGLERCALQARAAERDITGSFVFHGFEPDVWPAISAADIVCIPSKSEGMPNVLLEALAAARPIVATSVGGIPEALTDEHDALLVEPDNPRMLSYAISRLLNDAPLTARIAREGRRTMELRFHARDVARRYEAMYDQLLQRSSQRAPALVAN
jgi:glycosyltransferase involved in cell wall biosynthesis